MWQVELTDTFGGEANYSWVKRGEFEAVEGESQRSIMRKAKAAVGMTRLRGRTYSFGNGYEFRPFGLCQVMFVNWS
jgi:hypothetical protein